MLIAIINLNTVFRLFQPTKLKKRRSVQSFQELQESRRNIDGAENLWRIGDNLYDLASFVKSHPGGQEWITITKGTDITELFHSHHITNKAERLLPKFFVREAKTARNTPWTFEKDNFYVKFKERAGEALKNVDFHKPSKTSNLIADSVMLMTLLTCILAARTETWSFSIIAGIFGSWARVCGHNYFHMRDNFRMFYFDISGMSSRDWRITHVLSHHMYPNTLWDFEVYVFEPFFQWLPRAGKSFVTRFFSGFYSPLIYIIFGYAQGILRYYVILSGARKMEFRDFVPFLIPFTMFFFGSSLMKTIQIWLIILLVMNLKFFFVGLNAGHHHPKIFHDGDYYRDNLDWGLLELDTIRDRSIIDDIYFLSLTHFGLHTLHHLLPTVDHHYLHLCREAFEKTCEEFGIKNNVITPWEAIEGQFKQLARLQSYKNWR